MKKWIAMLLALMLLATLCACKDAGADTPETTEILIEEIPEDEEIPTEEEPVPPEEVDETVPLDVINADMALAESCMDKSVEELYMLIGEPLSADYAPSCLNPGQGEDGNLYYDGFVVYTYREGETETVQYVEEAE